jgi:hypothetical protein
LACECFGALILTLLLSVLASVGAVGEVLSVRGAIAQLGERLPCTQEVGSSILPGSTKQLVVSGLIRVFVEQ